MRLLGLAGNVGWAQPEPTGAVPPPVAPPPPVGPAPAPLAPPPGMPFCSPRGSLFIIPPICDEIGYDWPPGSLKR